MTSIHRYFGKSLIAGLALFATSETVDAQSIESLLLKNIPVPTPRTAALAQATTATPTKQISTPSFVTGSEPSFAAIKGSLKQGIDAVEQGRMAEALSIRAGMAKGSIDRKVLAWVIAISGDGSVPAATVSKISNDLSTWPSQKSMQQTLELAVVRGTQNPNDLIRQFANGTPQTLSGAIALAKAHLSKGSRKKARAIIAPFWHSQKLSKSTEKRILKELGSVLTKADHRRRMHQLFYNDRVKAGLRMASLAEQTSLAKARAASIRQNGKADKLIKSVAASSKRDTAYLFTRIENARRKERFDMAHALLKKAPNDPNKLVDPDEWWTERRIVSRNLAETGKVSAAYKLVASAVNGSSKSNVDRAFHAGWYALRSKKQNAARKHFAEILRMATIPTSKARGHYWLGRASSGAERNDHYRKAAQFVGTYYGQLANLELGKSRVTLSKPKPSAADRARFKTRDQVKALIRLEQLGHKGWAGRFYRHLARTLTSPGELAILAARIEKQGDYQRGLQVGILADRRGLDVDTLAWPLGAIPAKNRLAKKDKALAYAVSRQESTFNKAAVSPANARGMMQLLPGTAKLMARKTGLKYSFKGLTRDASYNVTLGTAYLKEQMTNFDGSYVLAIAAYNAGPTRVEEWLQRFGDPRGKSLHTVIDWVEKIPFTETRNYVQRVMEGYQAYKTRLVGQRLSLKQDLTKGRK